MSDILNHLHHLRRVTANHDWLPSLDCSTMTLCLLKREDVDRYMLFDPIFSNYKKGRFSYSEELKSTTNGFAGWRNYLPPNLPWSKNKLETKELLAQLGFEVPLLSLDPKQFHKDFLIKPVSMSFSQMISGPYKAHTDISMNDISEEQKQVDLFCEEFIQGNIIKHWFWGEKPVCYEKIPMPYVTGNGKSRVIELIQKDYAYPYLDLDRIKHILGYFNQSAEEVLDADEKQIFDYSYATAYSYHPMYYAQELQEGDDRVLVKKECSNSKESTIFHAFYDQIQKKLWPYIAKEIGYHFLYSVDLVLDDKTGKLYLLELNTNPELPVIAYEEMIKDYELVKPALAQRKMTKNQLKTFFSSNCFF